MRLVVDNSSAVASPPRRRRLAVLQANVARAVRVAQEAGPAWRVEIDGNVIRLLQGEPPATTPRAAAPEHDVGPSPRGLRLVP